IQGLDLTSEHYHTLTLTQRLGGRPVDPDAVGAYINRIRAAASTAADGADADRTLPGEARELIALARTEHARGRIKPTTISMLLELGLMHDRDSGKPLEWHPPRVIVPL